MEPATLFQAGFLLIGSTVLVGLVAGITLWTRWFLGHRHRNLCGDVSRELITRLPQPVPRWSVFDFVFCFGVMLSVGAFLQLPAGARVAGTPTAGEPTAGEPTAGTPVEPVQETTATADQQAIVDASEKAIEQPLEQLSDNHSEHGEVLLDDTSSIVEVVTDQPVDQNQTAVLVQQIRVHFIANIVAFSATLALLLMVLGATLSHLSLIPTSTDLRRGLFAAVWILTPVLLMNFVVSNLVQYEHKVMDLLKLESGVTTFLALFVSAAIVTPIVEEFQFRLLLQGGLQKIAESSHGNDPAKLYQPSAAWPIYVTSLIFAMMHLGQGGAPVALFFLSIGLGYLYQRTGRLWPVILIHMLLNATTLLMEFCRVNASIHF